MNPHNLIREISKIISKLNSLLVKCQIDNPSPGAIRPRGYKTFLCSTQLSMKFILLINVKMPSIVGILTFIRTIINIYQDDK